MSRQKMSLLVEKCAALLVLEKIVFEGKSVIRGDIRATRLIVDEGSIFDGRVSMTEKVPIYEVKH